MCSLQGSKNVITDPGSLLGFELTAEGFLSCSEVITGGHVVQWRRGPRAPAAALEEDVIWGAGFHPLSTPHQAFSQ